MNDAGIEVAICAHNASDRLPSALRALAAQTLPSHAWSILVVDNASTDDTQEVALRAWSRPDVTLRVVSEPKPGIIFARKRAFAEASRPLVCFCDDDNLLAPDYLEVALDYMERHPHTGALGGKGDAVSDSPLPEWFSAAARNFAVGPQADSDGEISFTSTSKCLYGAGIVIRRSAWNRLVDSGFKPQLLGRKGAWVTSGEDNEICLALVAMGWRLSYSHRLSFRHVMPRKRLNEAYCRVLYRSFGEASVVLNVYRDFLLGRTSPSVFRHWTSVRLVKSWLARGRARFKSSNRDALTSASHSAILQYELEAGLAEGYRNTFKGGRLVSLYERIGSWFAAVRRNRGNASLRDLSRF